MSIQRNLHFGNTEEIYQFCPEEILYMQAVCGEEETKVFLINKDIYILPNGLGRVSKVIDDTLLKLKTTNTMCRIGRSNIINFNYLSDFIGTDTIRLVADVDGRLMEEKIKISVAACKILAKKQGVSKAEQKQYQHEHFEHGYNITTLGAGSPYTGFICREYEPRERSVDYYDIGDDEIMFLGV